MYFRLKARLARNGWKKYGGEKRIKVLLIVTLAVLFALGEYRLFYKIFNYLQAEVEFLSRHLTVQLINIMNLTFLSMLFFSNLTNAIYYFFVSEDLELLMAMPIPVKRLLLYRYVENTLASSWMVIFAIIPFYVAILHSFRLSWFFILQAVGIYIPFFLFLSAVGCLVTLLIVNYFPAKKAYQILWSLSALLLGVLVIAVRLIRPERLFRKTTESEFMGFLKGMETPDYPFLPSTWITSGLADSIFTGTGEYYQFLLILSLLAVCGFLAFHVIAGRIYFSSFSASRASFRKKGRRTAVLTWLSAPLSRWPAVRQFFLKDGREIMRDTGQWSQLLLLLGLVFVYLFSIKSLPIEHVITMNMVAFFNTGALGFIMAALINRFVFPAFSLEGRVIWVVKTFPVPLRQVFLSKVILYFVPLFFFGCLISVFSNWLLRVDRFIYLFSLLNVFTITAVLVVLALAIGMVYPKLRFSNVTEVSFSYGGIVYMLVSMLYIGGGLIMQARPVYIYLRSSLFSDAVNYGYFFTVYGIFALFSVLLCWYFCRKAIGSWELIE